MSELGCHTEIELKLPEQINNLLKDDLTLMRGLDPKTECNNTLTVSELCVDHVHSVAATVHERENPNIGSLLLGMWKK